MCDKEGEKERERERERERLRQTDIERERQRPSFYLSLTLDPSFIFSRHNFIHSLTEKTMWKKNFLYRNDFTYFT